MDKITVNLRGNFDVRGCRIGRSPRSRHDQSSLERGVSTIRVRPRARRQRSPSGIVVSLRVRCGTVLGGSILSQRRPPSERADRRGHSQAEDVSGPTTRSDVERIAPLVGWAKYLQHQRFLVGGLQPADVERSHEAIRRAEAIHRYWRPELRYKVVEVGVGTLGRVQDAAKWILDNRMRL